MFFANHKSPIANAIDFSGKKSLFSTNMRSLFVSGKQGFFSKKIGCVWCHCFTVKQKITVFFWQCNQVGNYFTFTYWRFKYGDLICYYLWYVQSCTFHNYVPFFTRTYVACEQSTQNYSTTSKKTSWTSTTLKSVWVWRTFSCEISRGWKMEVERCNFLFFTRQTTYINTI